MYKNCGFEWWLQPALPSCTACPPFRTLIPWSVPGSSWVFCWCYWLKIPPNPLTFQTQIGLLVQYMSWPSVQGRVWVTTPPPCFYRKFSKLYFQSIYDIHLNQIKSFHIYCIIDRDIIESSFALDKVITYSLCATYVNARKICCVNQRVTDRCVKNRKFSNFIKRSKYAAKYARKYVSSTPALGVCVFSLLLLCWASILVQKLNFYIRYSHGPITGCRIPDYIEFNIWLVG